MRLKGAVFEPRCLQSTWRAPCARGLAYTVFSQGGKCILWMFPTIHSLWTHSHRNRGTATSAVFHALGSLVWRERFAPVNTLIIWWISGDEIKRWYRAVFSIMFNRGRLTRSVPVGLKLQRMRSWSNNWHYKEWWSIIDTAASTELYGLPPQQSETQKDECSQWIISLSRCLSLSVSVSVSVSVSLKFSVSLCPSLCLSLSLCVCVCVYRMLSNRDLMITGKAFIR